MSRDANHNSPTSPRECQEKLIRNLVGVHLPWEINDKPSNFHWYELSSAESDCGDVVEDGASLIIP